MLTGLVGALIAVVCGVALLFAAFLAYGIASRRRRAGVTDFVVVLGTTLNTDGQAPPLLIARLDRGHALVNEMRAVGGDPMIVVTGGQTPKDSRTEASAMAEYLVRNGVGNERLLTEDESYSTETNLRLSAGIMRRERPDGFRCAIVTSDYHCPRVAILARRNDLPAAVVGARTPIRRWLQGAVRDFAALIVSCWRPLAVACVILVLAGALTI